MAKKGHGEWPDDISLLLREIESTNDRSTAIMGSSFLDHFIGLAITSRLRPISRTLQDKLFEGSGPFATFSAKINVGFALSLYEDEARHDLHLIRDIRNDFAHSMTPRRFGDIDIRKLCDQLRSPRRIDRGSQCEPNDPKQRFLDTVLHLATGLAYEAHNEGRRPEPPRWLTETLA